MTAWSSKHPTYQEVWERDKGTCQRCGARGEQVHHRRPADRRENTHVKERLVVLCCRCHDDVHAHPEMSYFDGWLIHSWAKYRCPDCDEMHGDQYGKRTLADDDPRCPVCSDRINDLLAELHQEMT